MMRCLLVLGVASFSPFMLNKEPLTPERFWFLAFRSAIATFIIAAALIVGVLDSIHKELREVNES